MRRTSPASLPGSSPSRSPVQQTELAPRVAATITAIVILGFCAVALTYAVREHHSVLGLAGCAAALSVLLALQLCHSFPTLLPRMARYRRWTLAAQAVLTYLPFTVFQSAWLGMPGFLAASSLLVLRAPLSLVCFGAVVASVVPIQFAVGFGTAELGYNTVATALTGFVVYGLSRLTDLMGEVQAARGELARIAVDQERLRFARDLHDLLGYSLSTITLKCELTYRMVRLDPERAEAELQEILQTSRQALADVRSVASGYRHMNLGTEISVAKSLLEAVAIEAEVRTAVGRLPRPADTVLATVLREGITNMLRHSKAEHCRIEAVSDGATARITVANDGVGAETSTLIVAGCPDGGSGLHNLAARAEALGGSLTAGVREDGWFRLTAVVSLAEAEAVETGAAMQDALHEESAQGAAAEAGSGAAGSGAAGVRASRSSGPRGRHPSGSAR